MNNYQYLFEEYTQKNYHYFYKDLSYDEIKELSKDIDKLYKVFKIDSIGEELYNKRIIRNNKIALHNPDYENWEEKSKYKLKKNTDEILSKKGCTLYRALGLNSLNDLDKNNLGVCWAYDKEGIKYFSKVSFDIRNKPIQIVIEAKTDVDNIDWAESIFLHEIYPDEHELRIKNQSLLQIIKVEKLDDFLSH